MPRQKKIQIDQYEEWDKIIIKLSEWELIINKLKNV